MDREPQYETAARWRDPPLASRKAGRRAVAGRLGGGGQIGLRPGSGFALSDQLADGREPQ